jgi:site-specific DNA-methyltransferase (adenine-specific)
MIKGRFSSSSEYVIYATNGAHDALGESSQQNVFRCGTLVGDQKQHIAEKPEEVMGWVLGATPAGCTVLDPFAGSGTTGWAAKLSGRKAVLIEREERYCEIAASRMAQGVLPLCTANAHPHGRAPARTVQGVVGDSE